ncbi:MAG: transglutaminase family protein [Rhodospirillales bacterium]|nr:transglutaminase family protein [Rhodospirillales bacterium]
MPQVQVIHRTEYAYGRPVVLTTHRLMLRPQDSHDLRLRDARLLVEPPAASTRWAHDVFGNSVCILEWPPGLRTSSLTITSRLELTHFPAGHAAPRATLDPSAEYFPFAYAASELADLARLAEPHLPDPGHLLAAWARRFLAQDGTLAMLEAMNAAIHAEFTYLSREEEGTQSPAETLRLGSGACRDFALLMMEAARSLGLATRFVSGYVYDDSSGETRGGGSTHAWCAVYLPGAGWVEYDPTNGLVAGDHLVRIAVTRTPEQAVPIGGGFLGNPQDFAGMRVEVLVRAGHELPPDPLPPLPESCGLTMPILR